MDSGPTSQAEIANINIVHLLAYSKEYDPTSQSFGASRPSRSSSCKNIMLILLLQPPPGLFSNQISLIIGLIFILSANPRKIAPLLHLQPMKSRLPSKQLAYAAPTCIILITTATGISSSANRSRSVMNLVVASWQLGLA